MREASGSVLWFNFRRGHVLLQFVSNASFSANSQERRAFLALLVFEL